MKIASAYIQLYHFIHFSEMEVDNTKSKHDRKTLKDEHGQYPVWMNQKSIKKLKRAKKKNKDKKGRRKSSW